MASAERRRADTVEPIEPLTLALTLTLTLGLTLTVTVTVTVTLTLTSYMSMIRRARRTDSG